MLVVLGFLDRLFGRGGRVTVASESSRRLCTVHAGGLLGIVGESHRQEALRTVAKRTSDASPFLGDLCDYALEIAESEPERRWFRATLSREPENVHDANAIAVYGDEHLLGYLSREDAARYTRAFESLAKRGFDGATCPAMLTGGEGGKAYGVVLAISGPGHVQGDIHAEERAAQGVVRARAKDARGASMYQAAVAGESWDKIAAAHGYSTPGGAYSAVRVYAAEHNLELPQRRRGRPRTDATE
jgi:hypothetical protein